MHKHILIHLYVHTSFTELKQGSLLICHRCGPDISCWLATQMNLNKDHPDIKFCSSSNIFARPICLLKFALLVGPGKPWDFKVTQRFKRGACPHQCPRTVTLCGRCVNHDVPGNIHYGWVGRAAAITRKTLLRAADIAQRVELMNPKIRRRLKLEWICGISRRRGKIIVQRFLKGSIY